MTAAAPIAVPKSGRPPSRWLAPAIVAVLAAAFAASFLSANLIPDGTRDLASSLAIARGERFPLYGPVINFGLHLSPLWLYLQALPLLVSHSFTAVGLFVGVLAALRLGFAYAAGCALADRGFGLLLALAAAMPSIAAYQPLYLLHPALVQTCVWAALWAAARCWMRPRIGLLYACALSIGIAIQFHPTALFYAPLPWLLLVVRRDAFANRRWHALALLLPLVVAFAPRLLAGLLGDTPALADAAAGIAIAPPPPAGEALRDIPRLLAGIFWRVPVFVLDDALAPWIGLAPATTVARVALGAIGALALWGVCNAGRLARHLRWLLVAAACLVVAATGIVSAMREIVGYYATFFMLPLAAVVLATTLHAAVSAPAHARRTASDAGRAMSRAASVASAVVLAAAALAVDAGALHRMQTGLIDQYVGGLQDLRRLDRSRARVVDVSMVTRDALGPWLCSQLATGGAIVLQGDLAFIEASSFGIDLAMYCPATPGAPWMLGRDVGAEHVAAQGADSNAAQGAGKPAAQGGDRHASRSAVSAEPAAAPTHWLALPVSAWRAIGRAPALTLRDIGLTSDVDVLHPREARPLDRRWHYYETVEDRGPVQVIRERIAPSAGHHVAIERLKPWATTHEPSVRCDNTPQAAVFESLTLQVYALRGAACDVALVTDVPDWVGIVVF